MSPDLAPLEDPQAALIALDAAREDGTCASAERAEQTADAYARLADFIDPATVAGTARVGFVLQNLARTRHAPLGLFERAALTSPDADLADRAAIAFASVAIARGDFARAEMRLWDVLRRGRGSNTATERGACVNLARALSLQARDQEALVVSGRAYSISEVIGDPIGLAAAGLASAVALIAMAEYEEGIARMDAALECIEDVEHPAAAALRKTGHQGRLNALHATGRSDEALELMDALVTDVDDLSRRGRTAVSGFRAMVHVDAGRLERADAELRDAFAHLDEGGGQTVDLHVLRARLHGARGETDLLTRAATLALGTAERAAPRGHHARFRLAPLVPLLRVAGATDLAVRCARLAAAERLEQIIAIDRCARELPEFCVVRREDREALVQARLRFVDQQRACLAELSSLLSSCAEAGAAEAEVLSPASDGLIRVCAWCARVATIGDRWVPLGQLIAPSGPTQIAHGVCATCHGSRGARSPESPS